MMRAVPAWTFAAAFILAVSANAQDTTVKTKTKVKTDDAKMVTMTGCLQAGTETGAFTLSNVKTTASIDKSSETVGTAGAAMTYELTPQSGVNLTPHVGHTVEITALALKPAGKGDDDASVSVKSKTKVKTDDAPDTKIETRTKAEMPRGAHHRLTVASVKHISPSCTM